MNKATALALVYDLANGGNPDASAKTIREALAIVYDIIQEERRNSHALQNGIQPQQ